jgi:hypothetical protein
MDAQRLFLQQYDFVAEIVSGFVLGGLSDEQLRQRPVEAQNALAWLLWHGARWEDVVVNTWVAGRTQVLDEQGWLARIGLSGREVGTAMTPEECATLAARVNLDGLRGYRDALGVRTRDVVASLKDPDWDAVVDESRLRTAAPDGAAGNTRAPWLDQFFANRTNAWMLGFLNVHNAEHLIGEALCVRSQAGIPLGL